MRQSDAGPIGLFAGDFRVSSKTTSIPHPLPPNAAEQFIARSMSPDTDEIVWVIEIGDEQLVGLISLQQIEEGVAEIGYWIAPAFWGAGFASEAVERLMVYAAQTSLEKIVAEVFEGNSASCRVLTKAGFVCEGNVDVYSLANDRNMAASCFILDLSRLSLGGAHGTSQQDG